MQTEMSKSGSNPFNAISPTANTIINIGFMLYTIACLLPILLIVMVSLSNEQDVLTKGYSFIPSQIDFTAYKFLFTDWQQILRSYGVTIFVTIAGTILSLIIMALYAYPISRTDFPHRKFFTFFIFFTMLFNGGLVPWYLVYVNMLNLRDNIWALVLPLLVSAFFVLVIRTFFQSTIPVAILEAAKIDGASEMLIFFRIVTPLSLPVLATVALFSTVNYWNDWFLSLVFITDDKTLSIQYLMYKMLLNIQFLASNSNAASAIAAAGGQVSFPNETVRMAMAIMGIGPIVFAYPFFQKYFVKGLTVGAVKG
ncbi:sugar ABC transporter permease [Paenibacillus sp. BIHB 4019]|uniref:Sugar ABC transporter permease n=1 Tax=Paenibacillus sp. BIHB 4019 TaxID=1870819 RepID=A0A1B2DJD7_9BACL|nr:MULTISPECIES: carbohydrate ABC transporter permease [unclassified Paenibacillus]ANY67801.1 sugar ABC transporter permease [Paenibacillus sp. BIHB 4019]KQN98873.1 sugar ABC transporter permease [Paenibacillus sp. Leaf72]